MARVDRLYEPDQSHDGHRARGERARRDHWVPGAPSLRRPPGDAADTYAYEQIGMWHERGRGVQEGPVRHEHRKDDAHHQNERGRVDEERTEGAVRSTHPPADYGKRRENDGQRHDRYKADGAQ